MLPNSNLSLLLNSPGGTPGAVPLIGSGSAENNGLDVQAEPPKDMFFSVFKSLNSELDIADDEQDLAAWMETLGLKSGENLPLEKLMEQLLSGSDFNLDMIGVADEHSSPEQLSGDELVSFLMANSGTKNEPMTLPMLQSAVRDLIARIERIGDADTDLKLGESLAMLNNIRDWLDSLSVDPSSDSELIQGDETEALPLSPLTSAVQAQTQTMGKHDNLQLTVVEGQIVADGSNASIGQGAENLNAMKRTVPIRDVGGLPLSESGLVPDSMKPSLDKVIPDSLQRLVPNESVIAEGPKGTSTSMPVAGNGAQTVPTEPVSVVKGETGDGTQIRSLGQESSLRPDGLTQDLNQQERMVSEQTFSRVTTQGAKGEAAPLNPALMEQLAKPMKLQQATQALTERIQTMVAGEIQRAVIRLDPPELGALELRVQVQNDQTQVQIVSPSPQVREALEQHSARLREALAGQGLTLTDVDVSEKHAGSGSEQGGSENGGNGQDGADGSELEADGMQTIQMTRQGLIDQYI